MLVPFEWGPPEVEALSPQVDESVYLDNNKVDRFVYLWQIQFVISEISMEKLSPRDRIVATALRLFNEGGAHTVGIDQIIAESGVAKRTFYHHFPSKAALLAEFFRLRDELWHERLVRHTADAAKPPLERLLGIFDALKEWFGQPDFFGCAFIRGLSDFGSECGDPELVACIRGHFAQNEKDLIALLKPVRPHDYKAFVPRFMSLIAGATIVAHATRNPGIADINKEMARTLLAA